MLKRITKTFFLTFGLVLFVMPQGAMGVTRIRASVPVSIQIPKIHVSATVESRGLTARGALRPPSGPNVVAWDRGGIVPGNPGDAVMYGHLTDNHFGPAVFYNLKKLKPGDVMTVTDKKGTRRTFKVTKLKVYRADQITYAQIAGPTKYIHLTLYTCAGQWVPRLRHYSHYLVVYSSLVSVKAAK